MDSISKDDLVGIALGNPGAIHFLSLNILDANQIKIIKTKNITGPALWILWTEYALKDKENINIILNELSETGKCVRFIQRVNKDIDFMEYAKTYLAPPSV